MNTARCLIEIFEIKILPNELEQQFYHFPLSSKTHQVTSKLPNTTTFAVLNPIMIPIIRAKRHLRGTNKNTL